MLKKAIYYPNVTFEEKITPFGSIETTLPKLYETCPYVNNNLITIIRIDLLACLKEIWGENILLSRNTLYNFISGKGTDEDLRHNMKALAMSYTAFVNYCDRQYMDDDHGRTFLDKVLTPVRERIENYYQQIVITKEGKYKILMRTHEYVYIGSPKSIKVDYDEAKVI